MRYYIYATGSTCYDRTGITFPKDRHWVDLAALVKSHGGKNLRWQHHLRLRNLPKVLSFTLDTNPVVLAGAVTAYPGLMVKELNW